MRRLRTNSSTRSRIVYQISKSKLTQVRQNAFFIIYIYNSVSNLKLRDFSAIQKCTSKASVILRQQLPNYDSRCNDAEISVIIYDTQDTWYGTLIHSCFNHILYETCQECYIFVSYFWMPRCHRHRSQCSDQFCKE